MSTQTCRSSGDDFTSLGTITGSEWRVLTTTTDDFQASQAVQRQAAGPPAQPGRAGQERADCI
eukprot:scaffold234112_cov28-Prasinocladus_malaysianus.AAC.1